jgi:hypothetical protein
MASGRQWNMLQSFPNEFMSTEKAQRLYDALKRISHYMKPETLRKQSEKLYGVGPEEAIEMAYENVIAEAALALCDDPTGKAKE